MSDVDFLIHHQAEWLRSGGPDSDIVISSRIRLARNLTGYPFCQKLTEAQRAEIVDMAEDAAGASPMLKPSHYWRYSALSDLDLQFLLERHLVSREHAGERSVKAVALTGDESVSVMVLEEDHLRIQAFQGGFNLPACWKTINQLDDELEGALDYAFSPALGFLTACPTNVGTGLRASCMLHLPSLVLTKQVHKVLQALAKLNLAARGLYGEGTQATGNFFQFSNQLTLGQNESEIIDNLVTVIRQVIEHEKEARKYLRDKKTSKIEDQIWRAVGTLKSARLISSAEATQFLSLLQLGIQMEVVSTSLTSQDLNLLFLLIQPAHLQKLAGKELDSPERDAFRAELIRGKLKALVV
ncbi:MAG: protein arginine kinase [Candidatus Omnitrophota bacterium]|jgi:protein arginine kinase